MSGSESGDEASASGQPVEPADQRPIQQSHGRRTPDESLLAAVGHRLAREKEMYGAALNTFLPLLSRPDGFEISEEEDPSLLVWVFKEFKYLPAVLNNYGRANLSVACSMIETGRSEARNTDTRKVKAFVAANFGFESDDTSWTAWDPVLSMNERSKWGFYHTMIAKLLIPAEEKDPDNPERVHLPLYTAMTNKRLYSVIDKYRPPGSRPGPDRWLRFMYANQDPDPDDCLEGFLRSHLLVLSFKHLVIQDRKRSPSSSKVHPSERVTPESIAYTATLLRYGLSDEHDITVFKNAAFYNTLVEFLEDEEYSDFVEDLMKWWKAQVEDNPQGTATSTSGGTLAKIKQQAEAKRQRAAEARSRVNTVTTSGGPRVEDMPPPPRRSSSASTQQRERPRSSSPHRPPSPRRRSTPPSSRSPTPPPRAQRSATPPSTRLAPPQPPEPFVSTGNRPREETPEDQAAPPAKRKKTEVARGKGGKGRKGVQATKENVAAPERPRRSAAARAAPSR